MPAIGTDVTDVWSVRLSLRPSVCRTCAKAVERNETPFIDTHTRVVTDKTGPGSHVMGRFGGGTAINLHCYLRPNGHVNTGRCRLLINDTEYHS